MIISQGAGALFSMERGLIFVERGEGGGGLNQILTNEKHFPKTISQWEFNYGCFTNLPKIIVAFPLRSSKLKEVSYLSLENTYPKLKAACHINSELNSELNLRELTPCKISYTCHCDLKIKTSMTFVYKEYEVKIKMIQ